MSEDLVKLYSGRILALAAAIPHAEPLPDAMATARRRSPLCGSTVTVSLDVDEAGRIGRYGQDVKACALGQASAAISGGAMIGRTLPEVARLRDALGAMLREGGPVPAPPFDGYEVLVPARDFRNRHASILLALDATVAALEEAAAPEGAHARA